MTKLIKMAMIVASVGAMLNFVGCGGGSPDSVAKSVISCLKSADMEGVSKYSTGDFKKGIRLLKGMMEEAEKKTLRISRKSCPIRNMRLDRRSSTGTKLKSLLRSMARISQSA